MSWVLADLVLAASAAVIAAPIAWFSVRSNPENQPGWAVRIYSALFRASGVPEGRGRPAARPAYPRREAFLATWFLIFFVLFMVGNGLLGGE